MTMVKIEFEYEIPTESEDAEIALKATNLFRALTETRRRLRSAIELGHTWDNADDALKGVLEFLEEELDLRDVKNLVTNDPSQELNWRRR
ncbi:MAG: hypothetical protein CXR31_10095 [Geobacter sp.]|nr:MAG: hypothetical protein CXR31_10095 [Geobacter sp.]